MFNKYYAFAPSELEKQMKLEAVNNSSIELERQLLLAGAQACFNEDQVDEPHQFTLKKCA